ncbi:NAD-aldehyde dehydrogenase [Fomitiporia mediterranea MF3/22]|uniref:NAD-aldehyde dehydrogenase n=1 Tax=Fomitiporia mediterranea (strain MF3/22) TaxID=694068 RepID=UPI00044095F4|nr:NAD-aldehyde dehydrogenase [Fomitiporia mediterranea MF3/22]EJD01021.1 NAD-aldehyde dehydrogenase [Fomitiporia mediterranea MF3/22]
MSSGELRYTPLQEIDSIYARLSAEFLKWRTRSIEFRKQQLSQLAYLVKDNQQRFEEALSHDLGKPALEAIITEIGVTLKDALEAYNKVEKWAADSKTPFSLDALALRPKIRKEPKGAVLIIGAFNFPVRLTLGHMASAIAAGNACVIKPSESAPAVAALIAELVPKYLDPSLYAVVNGAVPEMTKLLALKWDHIMYTGGSKVARIVAAAAAIHLTPLTLELGGKNPVIVDPRFDLALAAKRIAWGRFTNAGQICVCPDYVLIPAEYQDKFVAELTKVLKSFYPDGALKSNSFARIVTNAHFKRIKGLLDETKGEIVIGGQTVESEKFIAPTIVKNVSPEDALMSQEIFGPVLAIVPVKNVDKAIAFVNARDRPLSLYLFTNDAALKKRVFDTTRSGGALCNDLLLQGAAEGLPFGGVGESGYGQNGGKWGFDTFTHFRASAESPLIMEWLLGSRYPPYTQEKLKSLMMVMFPGVPPRVGESPSLLSSTKARVLITSALVLGAALATRSISASGALEFMHGLPFVSFGSK